MNVGSIPPNEIETFMQKTISQLKRTPFLDDKTGEYNLKYNMQNMMEDFYIPIRGNDTSTKIETTPGLAYYGIQDVEYFGSEPLHKDEADYLKSAKAVKAKLGQLQKVIESEGGCFSSLEILINE